MKQIILRTIAFASLIAGVALPGLARAQNPMELEARRVTPKENEFYITPEAGWELGNLSRAIFSGDTATRQNVYYNGAAVSVAIGGRWDMFNLGLRYQGTVTNNGALNDLNFHKMYAEAGINFVGRHVVSNLFFDFGYAALISNVVSANGLGGKLGLTVDFYPVKWFSIGPAASFDAQGFVPRTAGTAWVSALGGTLFGRIGFHI